jgi:aspartate/methionine/tyrosine aminotransferase
MDAHDFPRIKRLPPYVFNIVGDLALAILGPGDVVLCPSPTYPIHQYSVIIAGGDLRSIPLIPGEDFFAHWSVAKPKATMFVWAPIPDTFQDMGSLEFATYLLQEAKVAVSPGIGFGEYGDHYVRFALIENEHRTRQAIRGIRRALAKSRPTKIRRVG